MELRLSDVEMYLSHEARQGLESIREVGGGYAIRFLEIGFYHQKLAEQAILKCAEGIQFIRANPEKRLLLEQEQDYKLREELAQSIGMYSLWIDDVITLYRRVFFALRGKMAQSPEL